MQLLVIYGATRNKRNHLGLTPYRVAQQNGKVDVAAFLKGTKSFTWIEVAAASRLYGEAINRLYLCNAHGGFASPPKKERLSIIAKSTMKSPWRNAPPINKTTMKLVKDYFSGWNYKRHWMFHARVRVAVWSVLMIAKRLQDNATGGGRGAPGFIDAAKSSGEASAEPVDGTGKKKKKKNKTKKKVGEKKRKSSTQSQEIVLPVLPPEIWLCVMGFFKRAWWRTYFAHPVSRDEHGFSDDFGYLRIAEKEEAALRLIV